MQRALATLDVFAHFCRAGGLYEDEIDAVATSAIRDAKNASVFLERGASADGPADQGAHSRGGGPLRLMRR